MTRAERAIRKAEAARAQQQRIAEMAQAIEAVPPERTLGVLRKWMAESLPPCYWGEGWL
jgi:hypothetical protein